jgi:hypothetical protein
MVATQESRVELDADADAVAARSVRLPDTREARRVRGWLRPTR